MILITLLIREFYLLYHHLEIRTDLGHGNVILGSTKVMESTKVMQPPEPHTSKIVTRFIRVASALSSVNTQPPVTPSEHDISDGISS